GCGGGGIGWPQIVVGRRQPRQSVLTISSLSRTDSFTASPLGVQTWEAPRLHAPGLTTRWWADDKPGCARDRRAWPCVPGRRRQGRGSRLAGAPRAAITASRPLAARSRCRGWASVDEYAAVRRRRVG